MVKGTSECKVRSRKYIRPRWVGPPLAPSLPLCAACAGLAKRMAFLDRRYIKTSVFCCISGVFSSRIDFFTPPTALFLQSMDY